MTIGLEHARLGRLLPDAQRDPFDRVLAVQALLDDLVLVTNDAAFVHLRG